MRNPATLPTEIGSFPGKWLSLNFWSCISRYFLKPTGTTRRADEIRYSRRSWCLGLLRGSILSLTLTREARTAVRSLGLSYEGRKTFGIVEGEFHAASDCSNSTA